MKKKQYHGPEKPYSYLIDNIKAILIFLVVFNHLIAFALVKNDEIARHVWYAITIFHMPAFIFVSGYLSKNHQDQLKNFQHLMIPYILGYTLTWAATVWASGGMDYDLLRPSGTAMWYVLALFVYRCTIEALGKFRFAVPLTILLALWAGTRPEVSTYLSVSRIIVFTPFFIAGYLWSSDTTKWVRGFHGKLILLVLSIGMLVVIPVYMINQKIPVDLLRENHTYLMSGVSVQTGLILRMLMYLTSFTVIITLFALLPDRKLITTFIGRNTMSVYFLHYPLLIVFNGLRLLRIPQIMNLPGCLLLSLVLVLLLGCPPVHWLYSFFMYIVSRIFFKKRKATETDDVFLQDEYDNDDYMFYV